VGAAQNNITVDGTFSRGPVPYNNGVYTIGPNLGFPVGSNLFHSFGKFGLATNETARFTSTGSTTNIIGRVTGGIQSNIDGRIQATNPAGVNLYLINPNGIVFGPNATLNVAGSFHASTADYLKMSDGTMFQATNPNSSTAPGSTITTATPAAFGFWNVNPAQITVNGSILSPKTGAALGLVAGPISITSSPAVGGAVLGAPSGTVHVTSVAGKGEVPVDPNNTSALTVASFGSVAISGSSLVDVSDLTPKGSGGSVFIRSGSLMIDHSEINADHFGPGSGGQLMLRGDNQVTLTNGAFVHSAAYGLGGGATIVVATGPSGVISADNANVLGGTLGPGKGGSVSIMGGPLSQLTLTNVAQVLSTGEGSGNNAGQAGPLSIQIGQLTLTKGGQISTGAFNNAAAGDLSVFVNGGLYIDGAGRTSFTGISSNFKLDPSLTQTTGDTLSGIPGNISVTAGTLSIVNSGQISAGTRQSRSGGNITVTVTGQLTIDGKSPTYFPPTLLTTGITSAAGFESGNAGNVTGDAGRVIVEAGSLSIAHNGTITSATRATGKGGLVQVTVHGPVILSDPGSGIISSADSTASGNAGPVTVNAPQITVTSGAQIASTTAGMGIGGSVGVTTPGALVLDGMGVSGMQIAASATSAQSGAGGPVMVQAGSLMVQGGAQIASPRPDWARAAMSG
jgi:filamentous hemagglutinin family protein